MSQALTSSLMILVPLAAWLLAGRCHNRAAFWILRVGGLFFALAVAFSVIAASLCAGDLMTGFAACMGPGFVVKIFNTLAPAILFSVVAYLSIGPILLILAIVLEAFTRYREGAR